jgi:carbon storage regulator
MLVLTRRVDESISIGENIVVTVLAVEGDRVKLGIAAPREVPILRQEVYDAIQAQNRLQEKLISSPAPDTFDELRKLLAEDADQPAEDKPEGPEEEQ